jgi:C2H2 transcription facotor
MATSFRPANSPLPTPEVKVEDMATPTTPRPTTALESLQQPSQSSLTKPATDDAATPTRSSFGSALASQKPLPSSPFPQVVQLPESVEKIKASPNTPKRDLSQHSRKSGDSDDVEMEDSDGAAEAGDDAAEGAGGSDEDSINADGSRSKKKKSQRFYCTDYPPCGLSFTRSEHLARHIRYVDNTLSSKPPSICRERLRLTHGRKHTGERPFQCHCSRRFSRLDNLRQHAQTVHVNEDIPIDSLAATGSRYQRQIRTERVRPAAGRARAATSGSLGAPGRSHSKSLSTSSINTISSVGSAFGTRDEYHRRRPPPLVMSSHAPRLSTDSYLSVADSTYSYRHPSPSDFSAPTSATLSTNQSSPRWSCMASPTSSHSRSHSMFASNRERRLSVPSANPFQSPHGPPAMPPQPNNLLTPPQSGYHSRRDSLTDEDAYRRRTWHPDSRQFTTPTSNLSSVANSTTYQINLPAPLAEPRPTAQSTIRLPGIESFDSVARPPTPPRRAPSPMIVDTEMGNSPMQRSIEAEDPRAVPHWDNGLHRAVNKLEISKNPTPPQDGAGAWANEAERAVQAQAEQVRLNPPTVRFEAEPAAPSYPPPPTRSFHQHTVSAPNFSTPREMKRHGWYNGPMYADPTRAARVDRMVHPNIKGWKPQFQAPAPPSQERSTNVDPLRRLEALVAVATNEGSPTPRRPY